MAFDAASLLSDLFPGQPPARAPAEPAGSPSTGKSAPRGSAEPAAARVAEQVEAGSGSDPPTAALLVVQQPGLLALDPRSLPLRSLSPARVPRARCDVAASGTHRGWSAGGEAWHSAKHRVGCPHAEERKPKAAER